MNIVLKLTDLEKVINKTGKKIPFEKNGIFAIIEHDEDLEEFFEYNSMVYEVEDDEDNLKLSRATSSFGKSKTKQEPLGRASLKNSKASAEWSVRQGRKQNFRSGGKRGKVSQETDTNQDNLAPFQPPWASTFSNPA